MTIQTSLVRLLGVSAIVVGLTAAPAFAQDATETIPESPIGDPALEEDPTVVPTDPDLEAPGVDPTLEAPLDEPAPQPQQEFEPVQPGVDPAQVTTLQQQQVGLEQQIAQLEQQQTVLQQQIAEMEDEADWGWVGLVGLAGLIGLAGLRGRDRDNDTTPRYREPDVAVRPGDRDIR